MIVKMFELALSDEYVEDAAADPVDAACWFCLPRHTRLDQCFPRLTPV